MFRRLGSVLVLLVALEALPYVSGVCPAKGVTLNLQDGAVSLPDWVEAVCIQPDEDELNLDIEMGDACYNATKSCTGMDEECIVMGPFDNMCLLFLKWSGAEEAVNHSITVDFTSEYNSTCRDYIFNTSYDAELNFTCEPVANSGQCVQWSKSYNNTIFLRLTNGTFDPDSMYGFGRSKGDQDKITIVDHTLSISMPTSVSVGYYQIRKCADPQELIHDFVIYYAPKSLPINDFEELQDEEENKFVADGSTNYTGINCRMRSFPPIASASWTFQMRPKSLNNVTSLSNGSEYTITTNIPKNSELLEETGNGQLIIRHVDGNTDGHYTCTGTNEHAQSTATKVFLLRVRDPLRPLWPAIGIIASFIITALFIMGGWVFDKHIAKHCFKKTLPMDSCQRPMSVSEYGDGLNNTPPPDDGADYRRNSKRLLLRETSDI